MSCGVVLQAFVAKQTVQNLLLCIVFVLQELEAIKARVLEMEQEAEKLKEMQSEVEKQMNLSSSSASKYIVMSC